MRLRTSSCAITDAQGADVLHRAAELRAAREEAGGRNLLVAADAIRRRAGVDEVAQRTGGRWRADHGADVRAGPSPLPWATRTEARIGRWIRCHGACQLTDGGQ